MNETSPQPQTPPQEVPQAPPAEQGEPQAQDDIPAQIAELRNQLATVTMENQELKRQQQAFAETQVPTPAPAPEPEPAPEMTPEANPPEDPYSTVASLHQKVDEMALQSKMDKYVAQNNLTPHARAEIEKALPQTANNNIEAAHRMVVGQERIQARMENAPGAVPSAAGFPTAVGEQAKVTDSSASLREAAKREVARQQ